MVYCFVAGGVWLLLFTLVHEWLGERLQVARGIPREMFETTGPTAFLVGFVMEGLFYVVIPTLSYGLFAVILPLAGVRPAMALALVGFTLGAVPALMGLSLRIRLWMPYLLYYLVGLLFKLGGCLAIIGYLYTL